jgi:nitrous oxidase accessory protein NosD
LETKTEKSNERESESGRERDKSTEYYYQHRDQKLEYQKKYNRQKGDAIKGYNKSYYMKRREEILEKARTKVTCECGCVVQLFNMNSHKKTKKHVRYLEMRQAMTSATGAGAGAATGVALATE